MKLIIVSGLAGAGKTIALRSLEDMGAYCVDNLPVALLPAFTEQVLQIQPAHACVAVGIDVRTIALQNMPALLQTLDKMDVTYEILFLEADDEVLIKRFSETRRKHPLSSAQRPLSEAIAYERQLLTPLIYNASTHIDTTHTHVHQLRDLIRLQIKLNSEQTMSLLFQSFGFKYGVPDNIDFAFDVRCLPNPHWEVDLRSFTGKDQPVITFLEAQSKVNQMLVNLIEFLDTWIPQFVIDNRSYLTVAIGCTGGKHRSVYFVEQLAQHFSQKHENVLARHRELT